MPIKNFGQLPQRLVSRIGVDEDSECWIWCGALDPYGYSLTTHNGAHISAHRLAYLYLVGDIAPTLQLDHLCRTRACVNPAHLEPVTQQENMRRGDSPAARNTRKTHCPRGHELNNGTPRRCPICVPQQQAAAARKRRALLHGDSTT